jgi:Phage protein Gp138 N-terminal domain/GpV Apex motif
MDRRGLLNDPVETNLLILDGRQSSMWTTLPCIVQSVNFEQMTLVAQPTIQGVTYDQNNNPTFVNLPILGDVPIIFPSAGGLILTLPIAEGDEVLVVFASRCIDTWWQSGGIQKPIEMRMHDLSDGFAFPGPKSIPNVVPNISSTSAQLRTDDGLSYIELTQEGAINLVSPVGVNITGNLIVSGEVTGGIDAIPLSTHIHGGVTTGAGDTGPPLP